MEVTTVDLTSTLPEAIADFEQFAGLHLTIHDVQGAHPPRWRHHQMPNRHLHRASFCWEGRFEHPVWNNNCTRDCLQMTHTQLRQEPRPFLKTCWKGGTELVVPIVREGRVLLILFAGVFRMPGKTVDEVPSAFRKQFLSLPEWDENRKAPLVSALTFFGNALLRELDLLTDTEKDCSREQQIRSFIQNNAHRQIGLDDLADYLHLSASRAGHATKEVLGMTFLRALQEERLNRALNLLAFSPKTPLAEVAQTVGFGDVYYFSRCFSRRYGEGPRSFLKKRHNSID